MKHLYAAIFFLILGLMLLSFAGGMICAFSTIGDDASEINRILKEHRILDGTNLKTMMNEAKYSPGLAEAYAENYPMYAYLFDGTFITYIDN